MEKKVTFGSLIKYGLLLGISLIVIRLIKIYLGNFVEQDISLAFMLLEAAVYVFFIYCAIRFAVKYIYATNYSFAKGVKVALFIGLMAAILLTIYQYIEMKFIIPEVYQEQIEAAIEQAMEKVSADMEDAVRSMSSKMAVIGAMIGTFLLPLLISLLASFFIAPFFKKRQIINSEESSSLDNQ